MASRSLSSAQKWRWTITRRSASCATRWWAARTITALAAWMFSVLQTVLLWGLNPHHWLSVFLQACADNGGTCPPDLRAFLPWQMTPERREELTRPVPVMVSPLTAQAQEGDETAVVNTS